MWQYVTIATIVYMTLCDNMWQVDDRRRPSGSLFSPKRETCEGIKEKEGATKLRPDVAKNVLWETKVFPDPEELLLHIKVYIQRTQDADFLAVIWSEQCVSFLVPCVPICRLFSRYAILWLVSPISPTRPLFAYKNVKMLSKALQTQAFFALVELTFTS